jgi:hypothetical protein
MQEAAQMWVWQSAPSAYAWQSVVVQSSGI